jgi:hypothetical protein
MNKPIPTSRTLKRLFAKADEMGFMPRADLLTAALEGKRKGEAGETVSEALCRVAAVENPCELNVFWGLPARRKI